MRLAEFILTNIEPILFEWETFARSLLPGRSMTVLELRDDAESILRATARDMQNHQSDQQQESKSKGDGGADTRASDRLDTASQLHGVGRVGSGFQITDVVAEYRALRASVLRLWTGSARHPDLDDIHDIKRFDEALDQSLTRSVESYHKRLNGARQMFLAILSHDLRNPLNTIRIAGQTVLLANDHEECKDAAAMIESSTGTIDRLISDLVDYSSRELGTTMPLNRGRVSLKQLCLEAISSCRATHPQHEIRFHADGEMTGVWDPARLRQVISNLLGNAIQHGAPNGPVDLSLSLEGLAPGSHPDQATVVLRVKNEGDPIPPDVLPTIFDPMVRYAAPGSATRRKSGSIGLGLYIVREITAAKGGTIHVASTAEAGTTFTVRIPRVIPDQSVPQIATETAS